MLGSRYVVVTVIVAWPLIERESEVKTNDVIVVSSPSVRMTDHGAMPVYAALEVTSTSFDNSARKLEFKVMLFTISSSTYFFVAGWLSVVGG